MYSSLLNTSICRSMTPPSLSSIKISKKHRGKKDKFTFPLLLLLLFLKILSFDYLIYIDIERIFQSQLKTLIFAFYPSISQRAIKRRAHNSKREKGGVNDFRWPKNYIGGKRSQYFFFFFFPPWLLDEFRPINWNCFCDV